MKLSERLARVGVLTDAGAPAGRTDEVWDGTEVHDEPVQRDVPTDVAPAGPVSGTGSSWFELDAQAFDHEASAPTTIWAEGPAPEAPLAEALPAELAHVEPSAAEAPAAEAHAPEAPAHETPWDQVPTADSLAHLYAPADPSIADMPAPGTPPSNEPAPDPWATGGWEEQVGWGEASPAEAPSAAEDPWGGWFDEPTPSPFPPTGDTLGVWQGPQSASPIEMPEELRIRYGLEAAGPQAPVAPATPAAPAGAWPAPEPATAWPAPEPATAWPAPEPATAWPTPTTPPAPAPAPQDTWAPPTALAAPAPTGHVSSWPAPAAAAMAPDPAPAAAWPAPTMPAAPAPTAAPTWEPPAPPAAPAAGWPAPAPSAVPAPAPVADWAAPTAPPAPAPTWPAPSAETPVTNPATGWPAPTAPMAPAPVQPGLHQPAPPAAPGLPTVPPPATQVDPYGLLPTESAAAAFAAIQAPPKAHPDVHAALPPQAEIDQALASLYGEIPDVAKDSAKRAKREKKAKEGDGSKLPRWLSWAKRTKSAPDPTTAERTCPSCGGEARVDIYDPWRGLLHMSCDACFRMWQEVEMPEIPALETADGKKRRK